MQKINILIKKDSLLFTYCEALPRAEKLLNTTIINNNELIFGEDYLRQNQSIVAQYFSDLVKQYNINRIIIAEYKLAFKVIDLVNKIAGVKELFFLEEESMPFDICEKIVENKSLEKINCFSIPPFMLEMLDRNNLVVETRCEVLFTSNFMAVNNLGQFSKMFYKTNVRIEGELSDADLRDFETFCKVNRYLKAINIFVADKSFIEKIVNVLHSFRIKNVKILIHKNITDPEVAADLKKINKTYQAKYGIKLKIVYSEKYLQENLANQLTINILKTCAIAIVCLSSVIVGAVALNNEVSRRRINQINNDLIAIIDNFEPKEDENPDAETRRMKNKFMALREINSDTVGWIRVNNTDVDYAVVQAPDNVFYLTRNYYKNRDSNGWIFMDFRNDPVDLGRNTIIYGHNMLNNLMFGTLSRAGRRDWYTNPENLIISFNTVYEEYDWHIFSIYRINVTSDYIQTEFGTDQEWTNFLEMIRKRSIHDFEVELNANSRILTLSTCLEDDRRFVVHAVMIPKE